MNKWMPGNLIKLIVAGWVFVVLTGFDFSKHSIPLDDILSGGPPKDGIPALVKPKFITIKKAGGQLNDKDGVLGVAFSGESKAYPIKILNWHEIVNDRVGGRQVVVTFCPLCGTGMVFDAKIKGGNLTFGVSGLLYQSDMLLYDHKTESLWSQIKGEAVTGSLTGAKLKLISSTQTTWGKWKQAHPNTLVLSEDTGYSRDYDRDPYEDYYTSSRLMFGVKNRNRDYHPKEQVIGIELNGTVKAYPFSELEKVKSPVEDNLAGTFVKIFYDKKSRTATIEDDKGKELPSVVGFWFAWYAFHPGTEIYKEKQ